MNYNYEKIKQALDQDIWSEVQQYLLDKLLEFKNKRPDKILPDEQYKKMGVAYEEAHLWLEEVLSWLMTIKKEDPKKTKEDRKKDSYIVK